MLLSREDDDDNRCNGDGLGHIEEGILIPLMEIDADLLAREAVLDLGSFRDDVADMPSVHSGLISVTILCSTEPPCCVSFHDTLLGGSFSEK